LIFTLSSSVSTAIKQNKSNQAIWKSKANARFGLEIALGRLQKAVGPDRVATATAEVARNDAGEPLAQDGTRYWTGAWSGYNSDEDPVWLISGANDPTPDMTLGGDDILKILDLPPPPGSDLSSSWADVSVPLEEIDGTQNEFAYWISDESVKANSYYRETTTQASAKPYLRSHGSALYLLEGFDELSDSEATRLELSERVSSFDELALFLNQDSSSVAEQEVSLSHYSVLSDPENGGLMKDLTTAFSLSDSDWATYWPTLDSNGLLFPPITLPEGSAPNSRDPGGPHWSQLRNFFQLSEELSGSDVLDIRPQTATTPGLYPLITRFQIFMDATLVSAGSTSDEVQVRLHYFPALVFWNPYDVDLAATTIFVELAPLNSPDTNAYNLFWGLQLSNTEEGGNESDVEVSRYESNPAKQGLPWHPFRFRVNVPRMPAGKSFVFTPNAGNDSGMQPYQYSSNTEDRTGNSFDNVLEVGFRPSEHFIVDHPNFQVNVSALGGREAIERIQLRAHNANDGLFRSGLSQEDLYDQPLQFISGIFLYGMDGGGGTATAIAQKGVVRTGSEIISDFDGSDERWDLFANEPFAGLYFGLKTFENSNAFASKNFKRVKWLSQFNPRAPTQGSTPFEENLNSYVGFKGTPLYSGDYHSGNYQTNLSPFDIALFGDTQTTTSAYSWSGGSTTASPFSLPRESQEFTSIGSLAEAPLSVTLLDPVDSYPGKVPQAAFEFQSNQWQPSYAVGSSLAPVFIAASETTRTDWSEIDPDNSFGGENSPVHYDYSWWINRTLWNGFFFSGTDDESSYALIQNGNSDLVPLDPSSDYSSFSASPEAPAQQVLRQGTFNINSVSVDAWKAILSSFAGQLDLANDQTPFVRGFQADPGDAFFSETETLTSANAFSGEIVLNDSQIDALAQEIVQRIADEGPFYTLADFINRNPEGTAPANSASDSLEETQLMGLVERAIAAAGINDSADLTPSNSDIFASNNYSGEVGYNLNAMHGPDLNQSLGLGSTSHLSQVDLLARLGERLVARADTYTIRVTGVHRDAFTGDATSAICEARIQRTPEPVFPSSTNPYEPENTSASEFGRSLRISSFRWLEN
ncbi:MAG: hypothetical protein ACQKBT_00550, partial [Puniceicoccales bacterium]